VAEEGKRPRRRPRADVEDQGQKGQEEPEGQDEDQGGTDKSMQVKKDEGLRTDTTATLAPLADATPEDWLGSNQDPDVLLSVPNLGVDHIGIKVDRIRAHVELHAKVLDLLDLHGGAQVSIEAVEINIENVRVQAMLKVKLQEVYKIVDRVMTTIDQNPEILTNLTGGLGKGLEGALQGGTNVDKGSEEQPEEGGEDKDDTTD